MIALIDADIVIYTAAARAETSADFGDDSVHVFGSKLKTRDGIDTMIADLKALTNAERVVLALSCTEGNYRKEVYPPYKSNRKDKRKPITFRYGREYAIAQYETMERPGLEADDILGILATGDVKGMRGPKVVCSIDKDMRTFPCSLYNWMKPEDGIVEITQDAADYAFYMQVLTGDSTDGYPGCPGIGPKRAARWLDPFWVRPLPGSTTQFAPHFEAHAAWGLVVSLYENAGLVEYDAITQARCARILRACDYSFEEKRPLLWTPPRETEDAPTEPQSQD